MDNNREIAFYRDGARNYMVLECTPDMKENYQYKMLAANQIDGLLSCSSRTIDNRDYLYYDITSRQSLTDLYDRKPVRGSDLQALLESLVMVGEVLTEYLLDSAHIILEPACIYVDFQEQAYSFTYYPGEEQVSGWEPLFTFLEDRVEGRDKQAAALIYRLCMMAEKPGFRLRAEILEELGIHVGRRGKRQAAPGSYVAGPGTIVPGGSRRGFRTDPFSRNPFSGDPGDNPMKAAGNEWSGLSDRAPFSGSVCLRDAGRVPVGGDPEPEYSGGRSGGAGGRSFHETETPVRPDRVSSAPGPGRKLWMIILSGFLLAGGASLFFLYRWMFLDERTILLSHAIGGVMMAAAAALLIARFLLLRGRGGKLSNGMTAKTAGAALPEPDFPEYRDQEWDRQGWRQDLAQQEEWAQPEGRGQQDWFRQGQTLREQPGRDVTWQHRSRLERERLEPSTAEDPYGYYPGGSWQEAGTSAGPAVSIAAETSLLGRNPSVEAGLYGTGNYRGEQISLAELPCVVGKMQDYVDQVLDDSSVSRMHARFCRDQEGRMTVRDLNSTNGTWLNGERLQPNETRGMEPGDHLRLGRMEFVFR